MPNQAERYREALDRPTVLCVIGRRGVGKSTLVNQWMQAAIQAVGLGGVTADVTRLVTPTGKTLVDTPGVDDPGLAVALLGGLVRESDALVWVTDGLQPATHGIRELVLALREPNQPLHIVVSRADLIADERQAVVARVQRLHPDAVVVAADLRTDPVPPPKPQTSPARQHALREVLRDALEGWPDPPPTRESWQHLANRHWASAVDRALQHVLGTLEDPSDERPLDRFQAALTAEGPTLDESLTRSETPTRPRWPRTIVTAPRPVGRLAALLGGQERAARHLTHTATQLKAEGRSAVAEWAQDAPELGDRADQWARDRHAVEHALESQTATMP